MRAIYYDRTGPAAEVLTLGEMPDPHPSAGEVLVRIAASGINPADVKRRAGWGGLKMGHPRIIPHSDGAGTIEAVGPGIDPGRIGERVWLWNAQGGYGDAGRAHGTAADLIALPDRQAVTLPDHLSFSEGACLGVPALTAHRCVMSDGPVADQTIMIQGGTGAVGYLSAQIARAEGARVIATVSTAENATRITDIGGVAINRRTDDVAERVLDLTGGLGVDRIVEVDFAANRAVDARIIRPNGVIASYSSSSDPMPALDYYAFASRGVTLRFVQGFLLPGEARKAAARWINTHVRSVPIAASLPFARCVEGHERVEQPRGFGQVVLTNDQTGN